MLLKTMVGTMLLTGLIVCLVQPDAGILVILAAAVVAFTTKRQERS